MWHLSCPFESTRANRKCMDEDQRSVVGRPSDAANAAVTRTEREGILNKPWPGQLPSATSQMRISLTVQGKGTRDEEADRRLVRLHGLCADASRRPGASTRRGYWQFERPVMR